MNATSSSEEEDAGQDCICTVCDICIINCCTRCYQTFQRLFCCTRSQLSRANGMKDSQKRDEIRADVADQIKMDISK